MPIVRSSEQKKQTLEEFYTEWALSDNAISSELGKAMLALIEIINETFLETKIYGTTSHARLMFKAEDNYGVERFVTVIANGKEFYIEYRIPKEKQPWKDASAKGTTNSIDEFIIIAMTESGGWTESAELKRLYSRVKNSDI